jgi:hypothetical protein
LAIYESWKANNLNIDEKLSKLVIRLIKLKSMYKPDNIDSIMQELPQFVRNQLLRSMYSDFVEINFFNNKCHDKELLLSWIIPKFKQDLVSEESNMYQEGDKLTKIFFLGDGEAGFVLPRFRNSVFIKICKGDHFGHLDIAGSLYNTDFNFEAPREND